MQGNDKTKELLNVLLNWIKGGMKAFVWPPKPNMQPSSVTLAALNCTVAFILSRPHMAGRALPTIMSMVPTVAKLEDHTSASMQKALARNLLSVAKSPEPELKHWLPKIQQALKQLGIELPPPEEAKVSPPPFL